MKKCLYFYSIFALLALVNAEAFALGGNYKVVIGEQTYAGKNKCKVQEEYGRVSFDSISGSKSDPYVHGSIMPDKEFILYVKDKDVSYEGYATKYKVDKNGGSGSLLVMIEGTRKEIPTTFEFTCK